MNLNNIDALGLLRPIKDDELDLILSWRNEPAVRSNMFTRHKISREEHLSWWSIVSNSKRKKYLMYVMGSTPSGVVCFNDIDINNSNCCWAFYASPSAARGTGARMEFLALDYVFLFLELNKVFCEVFDFNTSVIKLHRKFGFKIEGVYREQHFVRGKFSDVVRLGLLRKEWCDNRNEMLQRLTR